jgi:hypothetical protein
MRKWIVIAVALTVTACGKSPQQQASAASVTVKLPPAKPYAPAPHFSFGASPQAS